ncbi:MAG: hypothetical protein LBC98_05475 [Prevotellaceae bacterium]|nr:hypothetical protein [Prevotellaceae bacterium]
MKKDINKIILTLAFIAICLAIIGTIAFYSPFDKPSIAKGVANMLILLNIHQLSFYNKEDKRFRMINGIAILATLTAVWIFG